MRSKSGLKTTTEITIGPLNRGDLYTNNLPCELACLIVFPIALDCSVACLILIEFTSVKSAYISKRSSVWLLLWHLFQNVFHKGHHFFNLKEYYTFYLVFTKSYFIVFICGLSC